MNTTNLLSVRFFIKHDKVKNGCAPIYVRISVAGKPADVSLKRNIEISNWNAKKGQAQGLSDETKPIMPISKGFEPKFPMPTPI